MREIAMIVLSVVVAGLMAVIILRFLRRLQKIEVDMWGEKARQADAGRDQRTAARKAVAAAAKKETDATEGT